MKNRTAKFVSIVFVGVAAGVVLPAITGFTAHAAAECLAKPNAAAPQGSHWYYRVDRSSKRNCWYVRAAGQPSAANPATADRAPETPAAPKARAALRPAVANARAELAPSPDPARQPTTAPFPNPGSDPSATGPQAMTAPNWQLAGRWADQGNTLSAADRESGAATAAPQAIASAEAPPPATIAAPAVAPSTEPAGSSIWTLLGALVAALAVAGLTVAAVMKFGGSRPAVRRDANGRPDIWGAVEHDLPLTEQPAESPMNWIKIARERHAALDRSDEIERLLSGAAKRPG
ncbi:MAG: hypothetical protein HXX15_10920 [Rhodopseudomonas sp.]|uniref:hypothetical protein n=1 Tax=Rhodopseudomonas sp. TaxID=1078 RepID=UPI00180BA00F|nr:hypothetical protein [Rhodopseudomonas sp.]NVN86587.1 hypothetical protein [Rhodopseudomonas sp.]